MKCRSSAHLSSRTRLCAAGRRVRALVLMAAVRRGGIGTVSLAGPRVLGRIIAFSFGGQVLAISPGFTITSLCLYLSDVIRILFLSVAGPCGNWELVGDVFIH
jgi:hypothetical protein